MSGGFRERRGNNGARPPDRKRSYATAAAVLAVMGYWQVTVVTIYPGSARVICKPSQMVRRALPRRIRLALVEPVPPGKARIVLRNPVKDVWTTDLQIEPKAEYLSVIVPTWRIPKGAYSIEVQLAYPVTLD